MGNQSILGLGKAQALWYSCICALWLRLRSTCINFAFSVLTLHFSRCLQRTQNARKLERLLIFWKRYPSSWSGLTCRCFGTRIDKDCRIRNSIEPNYPSVYRWLRTVSTQKHWQCVLNSLDVNAINSIPRMPSKSWGEKRKIYNRNMRSMNDPMSPWLRSTHAPTMLRIFTCAVSTYLPDDERRSRPISLSFNDWTPWNDGT